VAERGRSGPLARPVLSLCVLSAFIVLIGLGVWQVRRLQWKQDLIAQAEAARAAAPVPLRTVLSGARAPRPFTRVAGACLADGPSAAAPLYALENGQIAWRALSLCRLPDGGAVLLDRGVLRGSVGQVAAPAGVALVPPAEFSGVLRPLSGQVREAAAPLRAKEIGGAFPFYVSLERETPPAPGLEPGARPVELSNNHLGYAVTWFGLAAGLLGVYAAMLRRPRAT